MNKQPCNFVDGVPVKISEKVRPPRNISLPGSVQKALHPLSLQPHFDYDFSLERRVLLQIEQHRQREVELEGLKPTVAPQSGSSSSGEVLTPEPCDSHNGSHPVHEPPKDNISITEFESDAFSPFDQVELQTLNDLEELSCIFEGLKTQQGTNKPIMQRDMFDQRQLAPFNFPKEPVMSVAANGREGPTSLAFIATSSQIQNDTLRPKEDSSVQKLPSHLQSLAMSFIGMGFPIERVCRAVMDIGDDDKKVAEHLCLVGTLVEMGFDEQDSSVALQMNKNDLEKCKTFLQLQKQFQILGFKRNDITVALKLHGNDRDKALDELLTK